VCQAVHRYRNMCGLDRGECYRRGLIGGPMQKCTVLGILFLLALTGCGKEKSGRENSVNISELPYECPPRSELLRRTGTMEQRIKQKACYGLN
jgi:hypothetical protein